MAEKISRKKSTKKIFVLDTCVLLDNPDVLRFGGDDVVIPFTVIEETDRHKRGNTEKNYNAREIIRFLDELPDKKKLYNGGLSLGYGKGMIRVVVSPGVHEDIKKIFVRPEEADNRILDVAYRLKLEHQAKREVIFYTLDGIARAKADALGIKRIRSLENDEPREEQPREVLKPVEGINSELIDQFYKQGEMGLSNFGFLKQTPQLNEYLVLRNGSHSALAVVKKNGSGKNVLRLVESRPVFGIDPLNAEQAFAIDASLDDEINLVTTIGTAGTGKTLLSIAAALHQSRKFLNIYVSRPVIPMGKDLGYLPGNKDDKLELWVQPIFDNISFIRKQLETKGDKSGLKELDNILANRITEVNKKNKDKLTIEALTYIRGRTLPRIIWVIDEAQNITANEARTIITRAGLGAKIIMVGDIEQIDNPYVDRFSNGLSYTMNTMKGYHRYAHISMLKGERSELASEASRRMSVLIN